METFWKQKMHSAKIADFDAFQSGHCAENNRRFETHIIVS